MDTEPPAAGALPARAPEPDGSDILDLLAEVPSEELVAWAAFRLAGRLPDEPIAAVRTAAADGWPAAAVEQLLSVLRRDRTALPVEEWTVVGELCRRLGLASDLEPALVDQAPDLAWPFLAGTDEDVPGRALAAVL